jgi:hypothetical protein
MIRQPRYISSSSVCLTSHQRSTSLTLWQDIFAASNDSDISRATEPVWPEWTDLVIGKSLKLTEQVFELQLVIRRTMELVEERFIFEDSFPGLITRNGWNQRAIKQACQEISGPSPPTVKAKYQMISDRSDADRGYLKEISSLVSHYFIRMIPVLSWTIPLM